MFYLKRLHLSHKIRIKSISSVEDESIQTPTFAFAPMSSCSGYSLTNVLLSTILTRVGFTFSCQIIPRNERAQSFLRSQVQRESTTSTSYALFVFSVSESHLSKAWTGKGLAGKVCFNLIRSQTLFCRVLCYIFGFCKDLLLLPGISTRHLFAGSFT